MLYGIFILRYNMSYIDTNTEIDGVLEKKIWTQRTPCPIHLR